MAWTDACKIEACAQIEKLKSECGGAKPAMRALSKECGIPINTLKHWYWNENHGVKSCILEGQTPVSAKEKYETCGLLLLANENSHFALDIYIQ